jgi:hypothetical protein
MHQFIKQGYTVVWPVQPSFIEGLQRAYPAMTFLPDSFFAKHLFEIKQDRVMDSVRIIPIRWAESIMKRPYPLHMKSKYDLYGVDWQYWKTFAYPIRNLEREQELKELLNIKGEYNLLQTTYGSEGKRNINVSVNNGLPTVHLKPISGYSLFDWCGVIEGATTIHAVSTSSLYLFEVLELQAREVHLYPRKPIEKDFKYVEFMFTKQYQLHE